VENLVALHTSLAIVAVVALMRWHSLPRILLAIDRCDQPFCDFQRHFYPMGRVILASAEPVRGFYYPPFAALAFVPFARLPLVASLVAWGAIQWASLVALAVLADRWLDDRRALRWAHCALIATSFPIAHSLKWGQLGVPLAALVVGGVAARERGRVVLAAALVAFATSMKGYPALVMLPFVLRRDLRFVAWTAALTLLFTVFVPAALMGPSAAWSFTQAVSDSAATALGRWVHRDAYSQFFGHLVGRLREDQALGRAGWLRSLGIVLAIANVPLVWRFARRTEGAPGPVSWLVPFACIPFFLRTSWPHYFVLLPLLHVLLVREIAAMSSGPVRAAAATFLGIAIACASIVPLWILGDGRDAAYLGFFFVANVMSLASAWGVAMSVPSSAGALRST
jgi:alpha-1,2-mannosyltransferase